MSIVVLKLLGDKESLILYLPFTLAFHSMYRYSYSLAFIFNFESPALMDDSLLLVANTKAHTQTNEQTKNSTPHKKNALRERASCYGRERSQEMLVTELP